MSALESNELLLRRIRGYLATLPQASGPDRPKVLTSAVRTVVAGFALGIEPGTKLLLDDYAGNCHPPATADELRGLAQMIWNSPGPKEIGWLLKAKTQGVSARRTRSPSPVVSAALGQTSPTPLTDLGNAELLVHLCGGDIRYCHAWDKWLVWNGRHWETDHSGEVYRLVYRTLRQVLQRSKASGTTDDRVIQHYLDSENVNRIRGLLELARHVLPVPVAPGDLDKDPWLFNCHNGTLDLRSGQLRPHDRGDLLTKCSPADYDPNALCPQWEAFLDKIMGGKQEMIEFLQRYVGYGLTGSVKEQSLAIFYGDGANGKSTFSITLQYVFGDYAKQAPPELLVSKKFGSPHSTEIADLMGARWVVDSEVSLGQKFDEAKLKRLTGGDRIKARLMYQDFFEFSPTHKLVLLVNHKPAVRGTDGAIWRRLLLVPFLVTIPEKDQVKDMADRLKGEADGILAWAVRGCSAWQKQGLAPPADVVNATKEYRADMDVFGQFLEERCVVTPGVNVGATAIYEAYKEWCEQEGIHPLTQKIFGGLLKAPERGLTSGRDSASGRTMYSGIRLRTATDDVRAAAIVANVDQFIRLECVSQDDCGIPVEEFIERYCDYCGRRQQTPVARPAVEAHLAARGYTIEIPPEHTSDWVLGIDWNAASDATEPSEPSDENLPSAQASDREGRPKGSDGSDVDPYPPSTQYFGGLLDL